jgi:trk system potassium uptake protein TrkH
VVEFIGAIVLSTLFMARGVDNYVWAGIFHSVSAFCTAGFTIFENGFLSFSADAAVSLTLSCLMLLGGIGFIVFFDLMMRITGKRSQLTFTSKVIILITVALVSIGTVVFHVLEKPYEHLSDPQQILSSFFQVVSACTTGGFSTINIASLQNVTLVLLSFFMIFGASPSGTGGGIKNTTLAILVGLIEKHP